MNILRFLSYFAKILSVNRVKSSILQNLFLKMYASSMAFETEYISRPNLGMSADVPDVPSHTSMVRAIMQDRKSKPKLESMSDVVG